VKRGGEDEGADSEYGGGDHHGGEHRHIEEPAVEVLEGGHLLLALVAAAGHDATLPRRDYSDWVVAVLRPLNE